VYAISNDGNIFVSHNGTFSQFSPKFVFTNLSTVDCNSEGNPLVVHRNGSIFHYDHGYWVSPNYELANDAFFGKDNKVYIHERSNNTKVRDTLMKVANETGEYNEIEGSKSHTADVSAKGYIVAVKHDGKFKIGARRDNEVQWVKVRKDGKVHDVAFADDDSLAIVDKESRTLAVINPDMTEVIVDKSKIKVQEVVIGPNSMVILDKEGRVHSISQ